MEYRLLGQTDIKVSRICLGTMTFGEQNTEAEAHAQLDYAFAHGVNFIDTAELYPVPPIAQTQGLTETYVGTWLKNQARAQIILATKVAGPGEWVNYIRNGPELNARHIQRAVESSLKRLQTDYIDLYQVHWPARNTNFFGKLGYEHQEDDSAPAIEITLRALDDLVQQGKVRYLGISNETPWGAMEYLACAERYGLSRIVSIQNPYSLLNRTYEIGLAEISAREQLGLLAYSPLAFGVLTGKYLHGAKPQGARLTRWSRFDRYNNDLATRATAAYVTLAKEHGLSPTQMALAYVNSRSFLTSNIIGATTIEQLAENIASDQITLEQPVLDAIEAIHTIHPNPCP